MAADGLAVAARLLVAGVFGLAGLAKLLDVSETRDMLVQSGFGARISRPLALALPACELLIAAALLTANSAWAASLAAIALLVVFSIVIAVNLRLGRRPTCRCFGQLGATPIGRPTLVRNALVIVAAGVITLAGPVATAGSAFEWLDGLPPAVIFVGAAALVVLGVTIGIVVNMLHQNGRLLVRIEKLEESLWRGSVLAAPAIGLPVGAAAPTFQLPLASGGMRSLGDLCGHGAPAVLVFASPDSGPCNELLPDIGRWQHEADGRVTIAVITAATKRKRPSAERHLANVLLQETSEVQRAYNATLMSAVAIGSDGVVASPLSVGKDRIERLLERTLDGSLLALRIEGHAHGPGLHLPAAVRPGSAAPPVRLPDRQGTLIDPLDAGRSNANTILLFWNPACELCRHLVSDVHMWESNHALDSSRLVVIATVCTGAASERLGLTSTMLFDGELAAAASFGIFGTPSAVMVDASGHVAGETAVGAAEVRALLRARQ